jgi:hypothetical protein
LNFKKGFFGIYVFFCYLHFMENKNPPAACFASRWSVASSSLLCQQMERGLQQLALLADGEEPPNFKLSFR